MTDMHAVLFVCMGNICRSPLAEAAFRAAADRAGLPVMVDSAGTGNWHAGAPPDRRACAVARRHGIDITRYRARVVTVADFDRFTHIIALDHANLAHLMDMKPAGSRAQVSLLLDHVSERKGHAVADPYYGDASGFDITWRDVTAGATALVEKLRRDTP
ncbi:low molecular weight protein-tyrosine-phosphatase [Komagataeibacter diospyri]|uniref:protein-tyrosine-phosphatase n=1 Tax=Komagataeibacter diospyri TaxID=1932662 RepID=A0A4P5NSA2_9PROT|nr:low molecular weight protein-tyrosine-phosphatase [Komagataeibacter diospyri]GCE84403.1 protein-tyrosine-phosphatase [Komagataeibacter diospyri]GCE91246.1 protein-tyrosine-phosphatase [Komagataeibacter diospyri]